HFEIWGTEGTGRAGPDALSGSLDTAGAVAVSRELQAGTDSSMITASTDARMEVSPTATDVKEDFPSATGASTQPAAADYCGAATDPRLCRELPFSWPRPASTASGKRARCWPDRSGPLVATETIGRGKGKLSEDGGRIRARARSHRGGAGGAGRLRHPVRGPRGGSSRPRANAIGFTPHPASTDRRAQRRAPEDD